MNLGERYRTLRMVYRHGSVAVYDAWSDERACHCVAKVLLRGGDEARARRRIRSEGRLLMSLSHPHIVRAYDVLEEPRVALILEPLPGETLARLLQREKRLSPRDAALLGLHLASALEYIHARDILHLDVKPRNVVCHGGVARLIDFGIARSPGPTKGCANTPGYGAPEQANGGWLSPATDVFGLGAVLYESIAGTPAFRLPPPRSRVYAWRGPLETRAALPRRAARAIDACLDPEPSRRPALRELSRVLAGIAGASRPTLRAAARIPVLEAPQQLLL